VHRWEGAIQREPEVIAIAKTTAARLDALVTHLEARHPYDVPCVVAYEAVGGSAAYLAWVRAEVAG
jgi:periplasmic divalent cation tolerance protein